MWRAVKLGFCVALLLYGARRATAQQTNELPSSRHAIHIGASQVNVNVMVMDSHGHFVSGLQRDDFHVFDNGIERPVISFASNDEPSRIVLLIESGAQEYLLGKLGNNLFVDAAEFANTIYSFDRVAIVTYSDRAYVERDFTSDATPVQPALKELEFELMNGGAGSSAAALSSSLAAVLYWLEGVRGKKAIVLISTGIDTSPPQDRQFIKDELEVSDIPLFAISAFGDLRRLPRHQKLTEDRREERAYVKEGLVGADGWLRNLTTASSGHAYFPKDAKEFTAAYAEITQFVRGEYGIGFRPTLLDGKRHSISVKVSHPWYHDYHLDHRRAYIAGSPVQK